MGDKVGKARLRSALLDGRGQISQIEGIAWRKVAAGHIADGVHREHLVGRVGPAVPVDVSRHVVVGKMLIGHGEIGLIAVAEIIRAADKVKPVAQRVGVGVGRQAVHHKAALDQRQLLF